MDSRVQLVVLVGVTVRLLRRQRSTFYESGPIGTNILIMGTGPGNLGNPPFRLEGM